MITQAISKKPLASAPDQAQAQLEELSAKDVAAEARLRAVAIELVRRGLQVVLVDYLDGCSELEATLPQAPHLGPVTVDRDTAGTTCQLARDRWADITPPEGTGQGADATAALLRGMAACPSLAAPSALTATRDPAPASTPEPGQPAGTS